MKERPKPPYYAGSVRQGVPPKVRYRHAPRVGGHTYTAVPYPPTTKKYY